MINISAFFLIQINLLYKINPPKFQLNPFYQCDYRLGVGRGFENLERC